MWTVDIDVGGTLTDGIFTNGEQVFSAKVDTTPHDLTVCLFDCLAQGAAKLGFADTLAFLEHIDLIRWSTTITSNVLAELRGPRIGLLVSKNHERDLYGADPRSSILNRLLADKDIIGLNGSFDAAQVTNAARTLLEGGVRRICVSLKDSHRNAAAELAVKSAIDLQYPDHFLGSVPVLAGSDISKSSDDRTRTYCAVINAYTHGALAATLFKAEDELRQTSQYAGTFLVSHINGGVAGIAKTKAIDTIESGPILGIHASVFFAQLYGLKDVVAMDIGGTTAKISVLKNGLPINRKPSDFFGIPVEISLPDLRSIALGGGSVVKPSGAGNPRIELGPESMGSFPGPACYALGGDQPTLTDAFVTAGLINPDFFLGGAKPLDRDLAHSVIENQVAKPMNISVDEACRLILSRAFELVADLIATAAKDLKQDLSKHTLFAYGGNGSLFACGVAEKAGIKNVQLFALGPVFSAFGSSVSDICHVYERGLANIAISDENASSLQTILKEIKAEGTKDLLGEGIKPEGLTYEIEIEASGSAGKSIVIPCSESMLANPKELQSALASALGTAANASAKDISLELMRVRVKKPMSKPHVAEHALKSEDPAHARTGTRRILWGSSSGDAQVYRWEALEPGNRVAGLAILEGINTTYFVPEGWTMFVDRFGNGALTKR
ncbi:MAG TPA: hydantoinase/oxoprolinase family protein [Candidatus Dormibacteraeota bacterium]|nr:hydantoinase/oxoprolinase family protein [Candidatus Dormibacteraeota bacterium]